MMEDLAEATQVIVDKLEAAGIPATADNRDLNPPGVYVAAPVITWNKLRGYTLTYDLFAAVPNSGRMQALSALGDLVDAVRGVWHAEQGFPVDLITPDMSDPLPAYRLPLTVQIGD